MSKNLKILTILFVFLLKTSTISYAQKFTEYEVKMVYLYQFAKFVTWPDAALNKNPAFIIGVYGENPFGNLPDVIYKDKTFKGKPCKVIHIKKVEDAKNCQMIFFSGLKKYDVLKFIKELGNLPILLVGDQLDGFCYVGGMINFAPKDANYRFEVNPETAKSANITISSKLFAVAKIVNSDEDNF
ncbi:MAG: YfiR family protein [Salinivirgaceae bacterium]|nr:YfiR family protein [Salinivirgaceae bacterium]